MARRVEYVAVDGHVRILLVEDDRDTREMLALALSLGGWQVEQADNGLAGLRAVEQDPPDVVITDISMPVMDGLTLCRRVRALPDAADVPIVVFTAHPAAAWEATNAGACAVLDKPYPPDLLAQLVADLAQSHSACPAGHARR